MDLELCTFFHHDIKVANQFNFSPRPDLHSYHTRYASDIQVPSVRTDQHEHLSVIRVFRCLTVNRTTSDLPITDKIQFKCQVKNYLISMYTDCFLFIITYIYKHCVYLII